MPVVIDDKKAGIGLDHVPGLVLAVIAGTDFAWNRTRESNQSWQGWLIYLLEWGWRGWRWSLPGRSGWAPAITILKKGQPTASASIPSSSFKWSPDNDVWELHNLRKDFSQAKDLAPTHPEKVEELKKAFAVDAEANKAFPIGGGLWSVIFHPEHAPGNRATEFAFTQEVVGVPEFAAPKVGAQGGGEGPGAKVRPAGLYRQ